MSGELEARIVAAAARQHGVAERRQLMDAGLSSSAIARRVRWGVLRPQHRGVYLVGPVTPPRAREMAAVLAAGRGALVSHATAASAWGCRPAQADGEPVDVSIASGNRGRRPGIRLHRVNRIARDERTFLDGIPLTTPARTLVDLAGVVGTRELEQAVGRAEREGLVDRETLLRLVLRHAGRPGTPALRALLEAARGPAFTRSEAEVVFLALVRTAGLPEPEVNVPVGRYEIDFLWRADGVAVEIDGFRRHSVRPRFEGDRRKNAWLLAQGISVIRLSWSQITDESVATVVQVGQALALAAGR